MQLPENAVILWQAAQNMLPGQSEDKCGEKYSSKNISNKIPFIPSGTNVMNLKNTQKVSFNFYQANGAEVDVTLVRVSVHKQQQTVLTLQAGNAVSKEKAKQVEASLQKWFPKHDWVEDSL